VEKASQRDAASGACARSGQARQDHGGRGGRGLPGQERLRARARRGHHRGLGRGARDRAVHEQAVGTTEGQDPEPDRRGREGEAGEEDEEATALQRGCGPHERQRHQHVTEGDDVEHRVGHTFRQPQDRAGAQDHRPRGSMRKRAT